MTPHILDGLHWFHLFCHYYVINLYVCHHFLSAGHGYFLSLHFAVYYLCGWLCLCMTSYFTFLILCIYVGLNQLFYGLKKFHNTNSISPAFSITTFEFQFLYIIFPRSMPGLCALSGNPSDRYATNVRIWALFTYLLKILFLLVYASHTYPLWF